MTHAKSVTRSSRKLLASSTRSYRRLPLRVMVGAMTSCHAAHSLLSAQSAQSQLNATRHTPWPSIRTMSFSTDTSTTGMSIEDWQNSCSR